MTKYTQYQMTEEFRDRNGFNQADMFLMKEALNLFASQMRKAVDEMEANGSSSIIGANFYQQRADDLLLKAESWVTIPDTFDDEDLD